MLIDPEFSNDDEEWTKVFVGCRDCPANDSYWCDPCCMNEGEATIASAQRDLPFSKGNGDK